jgi:signal transduction histidine kinase/CheY-like chemotaxis protein
MLESLCLPDEGILVTARSGPEAVPLVILASGSILALTGRRPEDWIGRPPPFADLALGSLPSSSLESPVSLRTMNSPPSGQPVALDCTVQRLHTAEGAAEQHAWVYTDRRLADTVTGLRALLDSSIDHIYVLDENWRFAYLNKRAAERFQDKWGKTNAAVIGAVIWETFPHIKGTEFESKCRAAASGDVPADFELELGGTWYQVRAQPYRHGLIVNYRDVTGQKQLEEQLRQSQKMEAIGKLAGGVAHDFNNILTVINGYSRRVLDALHSRDPLRKDVDSLLQAGERAADLTRQLLAFSRRQVLQPKHIDLRDVIAGTQSMLRRLAPATIEFNTILDENPCIVLADRTQLEQVLMNLAVNAIDAMPDGGQLTVEAQTVFLDESYAREHAEVSAGHYVQLAVTDTGTGMDTRTRVRIFEPFFTTKEQGRGTGLGLSTVYGIVRQSGGHIWVYSEIGQGTTFKVYLPLSRHEVTGEAPGEDSPSDLRGTETIFLVEDDNHVREFMAEALSDLGYLVLQAPSATAALPEIVRYQGEIHLLITDIVMPKMTGRDLAEALAPHRPDMRVLYCSGYTENVIVMKGILDPGLDYLGKPFSGNSLAVKVRQVLSHARRQRSIVVVDDDLPVRTFIQKTLEEGGYKVHVGANGRDAVALCAEKPVDLVLTDLVMPEQEGIETIRFFRKERPHIPVIAMSGGMSEMLGAASALGAREVIQKPIDPAELIRLVKSVIG